MFKISKKSVKSAARIGEYQTAHGNIQTPFFMVVATQGAVKHVSIEEIKELEAQILLSNTYHLMLRPGSNYIKEYGGLHKFIGWDGPILTDSGGFQIFSLAGSSNRSGDNLVKMDRDGVEFRSYIDGSKHYLSPEKSFQIQVDLGVDIAVCLDECVALPAERQYVEQSVELTTRWARKTKEYFLKCHSDDRRAEESRGESQQSRDSSLRSASFRMTKGNKPLLHCVIQGGLEKDLRLKSLHDLAAIGFDGYNIGGLSVGETPEEMYAVLDYLVPAMPEDKPRYLMGVGYPDNIVEAVKRGVDMFDCVIPTREGRHGRLFVWQHKTLNKKDFYRTLNINNQEFKKDQTPINKDSKLPVLKNYTKAYLRYLFKIKEPLGLRLASLNNIEFYLNLMSKIRSDINNDII